MPRLLRMFVAALCCVPASVAAQGQTQSIVLPTIMVTAQKEPADPQTLPVSVTVLPRDMLAGIATLRDAAIYSPNTQFTDFTARKLSNARFRGIGSSPANPAITTYFDGVPQLNANTSSIDLVDVEQIEFVRGPQSTLFGRNALAGVINVISARPSLSEWTYSLAAPVSNFDSRNVGASFSGPLSAGKVGISGTFGYGRRNGFTRNVITGNDVDSRSAFTGKGQLLWAPSSTWEARLIVNGERARDGDYALNDLAAVRARPFEVARDFDGHTDRDIFATTALARRVGSRVTFSTTSGLLRWKTLDETDLDYTPLPIVRRSNAEDAFQFTEEVRIASAAGTPWRLSSAVPVRWQAGALLFTQNYDQDAVNLFSPFALDRFIAFPVSQHSPEAALNDVGIGVYGQGTATLGGRLDVTVGARVDHENKEARLNTFFEPALAPGRLVEFEKSFSNVSPQFSAALHVRPELSVYGTLARGFKAGGFNAASPVGSETYGEEHTWNLEGGLKTAWAGGRVTANAAVFRIDWDDLQLNLPDPFVPAQFFIANVGAAVSKGAEFELNARALPGVDVFTSLGFTDATFSEGSVSSGVPVAGNDIPNTPDYTANVGGALSRAVRSDTTVYGRAEVTFYGAFKYDDLNLAGQESYSLTNLRGGIRSRAVFAEAWIRNAFDRRYVPVAFVFDPRLAPSGFLGEPGAPRTFGISAGVAF